MLVEKYLRAYNADKMEYQAMIFEKDSGTCWYCSADIEEPDKKNDRSRKYKGWKIHTVKYKDHTFKIGTIIGCYWSF